MKILKYFLFIIFPLLSTGCSHAGYSLKSEETERSEISKEIKTTRFHFKAIPKEKFTLIRDSHLRNAQEYCIKKLKAQLGDSLEVWSIFGSHIEEDKNSQTFSFQCDVAYFKNKSTFKKSLFTQLESNLDYRTFHLSSSGPPTLITKVRRLPVSPFLRISLENIEPNQALGLQSLSEVKKLITHGNPTLLKDSMSFHLIQRDEDKTKDSHASLVVYPSLKKSRPRIALQIQNQNQIKTLQFIGSKSFLKFPNEFKWAIATSAHQIEGGNTNSDWYQFEQTHGNVFQNETSDDGPDHWNRVEEDIALLKKLGVHQYRMSIEWSRLEPTQGQWDKNATDHYKKEIQLLRKNGIEPVITLWHSTLPLWIAEKKGWEWSGIPRAFEVFSLYVLHQIAPDVQYWVTLNEPLPYLMGAYIRGCVPPAKEGSFANLERPLVQMLKAHARVYRAFHDLKHYSTGRRHKEIQVGIAHRMDMFAPYQSGMLLDRWAAGNAQKVFNWAIPNAIKTGQLKIEIPLVARISRKIPELKGTQDFYGINYYTRFSLSANLLPLDVKEKPAKDSLEVTDMGWEIYPEGLYILLSQVKEKFPNLPVLITESGIADSSDRLREKYIRSHLVYLHHAIQKGIPVLNYSYWSLYDNFEWDQGFSIRVGLYETDFKTKQRIPRKSAQYFEKIVKRNGVSLEKEG